MQSLELLSFSHVGLAVRSVEEFRRTWGDALGVTDWIVHREDIPEGLRLHGEATGAISANVAFGKCGGVALELIETLSGRTHHRDHIDSRGAGLHHLAFWVRDLAKELEKIDPLGLEVVMAPPQAPGSLAGMPVSVTLPGGAGLPDTAAKAAQDNPLVVFLDMLTADAHFALELLDSRFASLYPGVNTFDPPHS
jgi:catechol 2,3-dioxygenase-like lactoylglutathione lyase family enzyme